MKINGIKNYYQNIKQYKSKENIKSQDIKEEKPINVEISKTAKELAEKVDQAKSMDYSGKVEKIRASILDGSYKVDSEKIAEKITEKIEAQKGSEG